MKFKKIKSLLICLIFMLGIVFLITGCKNEIKDFYIKHNEQTINESNIIELSPNKTIKLQMYFPLGMLSADIKNYSVKVESNKELKYTVNGADYNLKDSSELSKIFNVKIYEQYFTFVTLNDIESVLQALHPDKEIKILEEINLNEAYFKLEIANLKRCRTEIKFRFLTRVEKLDINDKEIIV